MDSLSNQISISLSTPVIIILAIVLLFILALIIYLSVKLRKATQLQPKYGFLGKSLYPLVTVVLLGVGIVMAVVAINNDKIFQLKAQKQLQAEIFTNTLVKNGPEYYIDIKAVPTVEGKIWGKEGEKFDIYWSLRGTKDYNFVELGKSNDERSGIQEYVEPGTYKVTVTVIYQEAVYTFTKDVTF